MRTPKLRRMIGVFAVAALAATACQTTETGGDATETPDTGASPGTESPTDGTEAPEAGEYDWSDPLRRQAVSMAINREEIADVIFQGARTPGDDFWPSTFVGYRGGDYCENLQYNPEEAAALWEEAGGNAGPITLWFNSGAGHEEWIEAVANMLQQNLGVEDVNFESLEFADYLDRLDNAEVDGPFRLGWLMDYPSPGNFLGPLHGTEGSSNHTGYTNEEFDNLVEQGDSKPLDEAVEDYQAAADILCEDLPVAPMFFGLLQGVYSENVENVSFDAFEQLNVTEVTDVDGDGEVSMFICEPQNALFGQMTNETCGSEVVNGLFAPLAELNKETGELEFSGTAESIETDDGGQTWTITLKEGWTFHNGEPVNAESYARAWNWAANPDNAAQNNYFIQFPGIVGYDAMQPETDEEGNVVAEAEADSLEGVRVVDERTLEVELEQPFPQFDLVLLYNAYNPLPAAFEDDPEAFGESPIGNGPFMMDPEVNNGQWEHDVQVATVAYPDYAGDAPQIDRLVYRIYSDNGTGYNDVRSGALDIIDQLPTAEIQAAQDEFGDRYFEEATSSFNYLGFPIDLELAASWHAG